MKPIKLKIKGINSFIEEQVVDFEKLAKDGLFGIFGSTGSGKTTILDGISLSLYGEVARNSKNFVNKNCEKGFVSFEFQITTNEEKRYLIEREFKKIEDGNDKSGKCRLLDITEDYKNPVVLADSITAIKTQCRDIIGLDKEDFFRTVVIPQGKFNEFLNLDGKERREMLERLFNLQEYGKKMEQKLKNKDNDLKIEQSELSGKLSGFSDINNEMADALENEIRALEIEFKNLLEEKNVIENEFEISKKLWELTKNKEMLDVQLQNLNQEKENIENIKNAISKHEKASIVKPYIIRKFNIEKEYAEKTTEYDTTQKNIDDLRRYEKDIVETYNQNDYLKREKIPVLIEKKTKLGGLLLDEKQLIDLNIAVEKLEKGIVNSQGIREEINAKVGDRSKDLEEKKLKLNELNERKDKAIVLPKVREKLQDALGMLSFNEMKEREIQALNLNVENYNLVKENLNLQNKKFTKEIDDLRNEISGEYIGNVEKNIQDTKQEIEEIERLKQEYQVQNIVNQLQSECEVGQPCPVCGNHLDKPITFKNIEKTDYDLQIKSKKNDVEKLEKDLKNQISLNEKNQNDVNIKLVKTTADFENTENLLQKDKSSILDLKNEIRRKEVDIANIQNEIGIADLYKLDTQIKENDALMEQFKMQEIAIKNEVEFIEKELGIFDNQVKEIDINLATWGAELREKSNQKRDIENKLKEEVDEFVSVQNLLNDVEKEISNIDNNFVIAKKNKDEFDEKLKRLNDIQNQLKGTIESMEKTKVDCQKEFEEAMKQQNLNTIDEVRDMLLKEEQYNEFIDTVKNYEEKFNKIKVELEIVIKNLNGQSITQEKWLEISDRREIHIKKVEEISNSKNLKEQIFKEVKSKLQELGELLKQKEKIEHTIDMVNSLRDLFKGKRFVEYIAVDRLKYVCHHASKRLREISDNNYELLVDNNGKFLVRHISQGSVLRETNTLSGGETFIVSLALALALSAEIQLKSKAPLELFFLDEGFGTLDENLLDVVMTSIEKIHNDRMKIGIISHVESLKTRVPVKLNVIADRDFGSRVKIELT